MKKRIILMSALACAFMVFTGCSDDNDEPKLNWATVLPSEQITVGDNLSVNFNNDQASAGSVKFAVDNTADNAATVSLLNIIPGYGELNVPVTLSKTADKAYAFTGKLSVTSAPAMTRMEAAGYSIYDVIVNGTIIDSKCTVNVTSALSEQAQGGLTGTWNLLDKAVPGGENGGYKSAPLMMTWTANDATKPNMQSVAGIISAMGGPVLFNLLQNVTFNADGNITASYYTPLKDENVMDFIGGSEENEDGSYTYKVVHQGEWSQSKKNLAFWYAKDGYIYVTPNLSAILGATGAGDLNLDIETIANLAQMIGVDADKLKNVLTTWNKTGIPLKYTVDGNNLSLTVDKEMAAPVIELLLPTLPMLQKMYENMQKNDPDTAGMISMLLFMMNGAQSFEDIATIWKENTKEFGINLNFTK